MAQPDEPPVEPYSLGSAVDAAPEELYAGRDGTGYSAVDDIDEPRFIIYDAPDSEESDGIHVLSADQVREILEEGMESGKRFPVFKSLEMSKAFLDHYNDKTTDTLVTSRIEDGEPSDMGYFLEDGELAQIINFHGDQYHRN